MQRSQTVACVHLKYRTIKPYHTLKSQKVTPSGTHYNNTKTRSYRIEERKHECFSLWETACALWLTLHQSAEEIVFSLSTSVPLITTNVCVWSSGEDNPVYLTCRVAHIQTKSCVSNWSVFISVPDVIWLCEQVCYVAESKDLRWGEETCSKIHNRSPCTNARYTTSLSECPISPLESAFITWTHLCQMYHFLQHLIESYMYWLNRVSQKTAEFPALHTKMLKTYVQWFNDQELLSKSRLD